MAIYKQNNLGDYEALTDKEIKARILDLTGWTTQEYNKQYDRLRNRVKNYQSLTGGTEQLRTNEILYRTLQRQAAGVDLTAEQQAILKVSSASTAAFKRSVETGTVSKAQLNIGVQAAEKIFHNMIEQSPTVKARWEAYLNEVVRQEATVDPETGEILGYKDIRRAEELTPEEAFAKLKELAKDLHAWQEKQYKSNRGKYGGKRRNFSSSGY